ncbi:hypothetical protein [Streptomyces sp. NPDC050534]|uniref:hypothetical protein n=1 Tax=Streptomyces sp. NPDC050534 TaxID=3365625 RepID=UPI00379AA728
MASVKPTAISTPAMRRMRRVKVAYSVGATLRWRCEHDCGAHGTKRYPSAEDAERYAQAFDHEDSEDLGRRAPLV